MNRLLQRTTRKMITVCLIIVLAILQLYTPNVSASDSKGTITLNYSKKTMKSGETLKLKVKSRSYKLPEENDCYWESSDTNIATVDEKGTVTALAPGTVTITYVEESYELYDSWYSYFYNTLGSASCQITVKQGKYSLEENELTMVEGDITKIQLPISASFEYNTQMDYSEWPYGYVSVTADKDDSTLTITAYDEGTVNLYVNFYNAKGKFVCADRIKITILRRGIDVDRLSCAVGNKYQFTVNGFTKDQIISWESSNPEIATINSSGKLTAVSEGETMITLGVQTKEVTQDTTEVTESNSSEENEEDVWEDVWEDDWGDDWYEDWYEDEWMEDDDGIEYFECWVYITNPRLVVKSQNLANGYSDYIELEGTSMYSSIEATSSKPEVVSVSDLYICANAKGTSVITLNVDGVKLKYTVRVTDPQIDVSLIPLVKGKTTSLNVRGTNQYSEIKYKTTDKSIVTVSKDGLIKGKGYGVATVTAVVDGKELQVPISVSNSKVVTMLNYGLSAIGAAYSQTYRMSENYYDCSSLAWRSYHAANINFGNDSWAPTAASIAEYCVKNGFAISYEALSAEELQPGDLIFFAKGDNGRYKNIYHVAIYAGAYVTTYSYGDETTTYTEGLLLEARNEGVGLFNYNQYQRNVVVIARPTKAS